MSWVGTKLRWVSMWERVLVVLLVAAFFAANTYNLTTSVIRAVDARNSPATTSTRRQLPQRPQDATLFLCASTPGDIVDHLVCELTRFTLNVSDPFQTQTVACNARPVTLASGFRCLLVDDVLGFPDDVFAFFLYGRTTSCSANPAQCAAGNVYGTAIKNDDVPATLTKATVDGIAAVPLPTGSVAHIRIATKIIHPLSGRETTKYQMAAFTMRSFVKPTGESLGNVSFAIEINAFSWDLSAELVSEIVVYTYTDVVSSAAAIFGLTTGIFFFLFPTSANLPVHFRFGAYRSVRNVSHIVPRDKMPGAAVAPTTTASYSSGESASSR